MDMSDEDGYPDCIEAIEIISDSSKISPEDTFFDLVIGHIEDVIIDKDFQNLQQAFLDKYWCEFEDADENKLSYMEIFKEYIDSIERHIERYLEYKIPNFTMQQFADEIQKRRAELEGEVFEMLYTFTDFSAFKEMFLDYKAVKEGRIADLSLSYCVS